MLTGILVKIAINFEKIPYILDVSWFDWGWGWTVQRKESFHLRISLLNVKTSLDTWELFTFTKNIFLSSGFWFKTLKNGRSESVKCIVVCYLLKSSLISNSFHQFRSFSNFDFKTLTWLYLSFQRVFCKKSYSVLGIFQSLKAKEFASEKRHTLCFLKCYFS